MKKYLLITIAFLIFTNCVYAQDFAYGVFKQADIDMAKYDKDPSAHAVVLSEYGQSRINVASDDNIKLIYNYHIKIKIFDDVAFNEGTVEIPIYNSDQSTEEVLEISGVTYSKEENGIIKKVELDPGKVFTVKENKNHSTVKFALPGLRKGCIIEFKYTIISPYFEDFHNWQFQSDIPKMYSEYEVHIPAFWNYNAVIRGDLQMSKNTSEVERECFSSGGAKSDCSHFVYGMKDIPAFVAEDYMTAPKNFLSAMNFELSDYTNPYTGVHNKIAIEWTDVDKQLKRQTEFGSQLKKKDLFKTRLAQVLADKTDDLAKAKAVYTYIQKNIKWNKYYSFLSIDGIRKALDEHTGNIADINLSLVTALSAAGLQAEAVLLSTRENGIINKLYPVITEFNYVIAKVNIGDKSYLLDATDPLLSFGMLPLRCLNDQGRVMSLDKPSYWINMNTGQKRSTTYSLDLTLQDNGKLKGTLTRFSKDYDAYRMREVIKKFNTLDEYVEDLGGKLTKIKFIKSNIANVDSLDQTVAENYEIEIDAFDKMNSDRLSFNPFFLDKIVTNPFKLANRTYPVDLGMPSEERFVLTVHLPDGYTIENPPQSATLGLPNRGGRFMVVYDGTGNSFTLSHITELTKPIYSSAEYPYLKELYNKIILAEKAEIVFKKKI